MEKSNIKEWLDDLLKIRFGETGKTISNLTSLDLFYLYLEIYKEYNVKLPIELLISSAMDFELIVDAIYRMAMSAKNDYSHH